MFLCAISGNFERIQCSQFETNFLKSEKNGVPFLVGRAKTEKAIFSYKTALSEASVKENRMRSIK